MIPRNIDTIHSTADEDDFSETENQMSV